MNDLSLPRRDMYLVVIGDDITGRYPNVVDAFEEAERASREINETFSVYRLVGDAEAVISHRSVLY